MTKKTDHKSVMVGTAQYVVVQSDGKRAPIIGARDARDAMRVFQGPWRKGGDRLVYEQTVAVTMEDDDE